MGKSELLEQGFVFGPFKTEHHQRAVDDQFRKALIVWLVANVLPQVEGSVTRVEGRLYSHYDDQKFFGTNSILKHRYYFEISFHSPEGTETAGGELEYDRDRDTFTPTKVKPWHVKTLSSQRRLRELIDQANAIALRVRDGERDIACPNCSSPLSIWVLEDGFVKNIACPKERCFWLHFD